MHKKLLAEYFGTSLLLAVIVGSGFMGETLGAGNTAVILLANSIATGAGLYVLITTLAPISGAHFNPLVSIMCWKRGDIKTAELLAYIPLQLAGAVSGVWLSHLMFDLPILQFSTKPRAGSGIWLSELISTLILLSVIIVAEKKSAEKIPILVALVVTAGYWFTSSTFFANPAVTLARSLTNTFVGIRPVDTFGFISAQLVALVFICLFVRKGK